MQVSVEALGGLERRMTVQVPTDQMEKAVQQRLQSLTRTARLDGFRPGRIPYRVVEKKFGPRVRQEVVGDLLQSSFYEAVQKEKLQLAGGPRIEPQNMEPGKDLEYTATFEVLPQIELKDLEGIEVEKPVVTVEEADVDRLLESLRRQRTQWVAADRAAAEGDRVTIDFEGKVDGKEFPGNQAKSVPVVLGSGTMIEGFEQQLEGAKAGEERTLKVTFPEDYRLEEIAGKEVEFAVKVEAVEAPELPELDDGFAREFGVEEGGMEALRKEVRANMERELEQRLKARTKEKVFEALLAQHEIELPKALVHEEVHQLAEHMKSHAPEGVQVDASEESAHEKFQPDAERRVALGLLISEVIKQNDIRLDKDRVRQTVEQVAASYEEPEEVVKWYYADRQRLASVETAVLEEQVVDWLLERVHVKDEPIAFETFMNPQQG